MLHRLVYIRMLSMIIIQNYFKLHNHATSFCKRSILGCYTHLETESALPFAEIKALKYCRKWLEQAILHYMQKQLRI